MATTVAAGRLVGNGGTSRGQLCGHDGHQALELKVNGARAFGLEPNVNSPNVIAGLFRPTW